MPAPFMPYPIGGVYVYYNVQTKKGYVGQSGDLGQRFTVIMNQLAAKCHHNSDLQEEYNKYGDGAFAFKILRRVDDKDERLDAEHEILTRAIQNGRDVYNKNRGRDDGEDWR